MRLDKYLKVTRLIKRRTIANEACDGGRVSVNGKIARASYDVKVGDEITTIGGIIGKIVSIKDETVTIETSHDRTKMRILKSAVRSVDVKAEDAQD